MGICDLKKENKNGSYSLPPIFIVVVMWLSFFEASGQSNHTVTFSGNASDFNTAERISAAANNTDYYLTFDDTYLYIGAFRTGGSTFGGSDNLAIYLDTDPNATPASGTGTTTGQLYNGVTGTLPFSANYSIHVEEAYQEMRSYNASWASTISGNTYNTNTTAREVRIPLSSIGNPHSLYLTMWMGYGGGFYSNSPGANLSASTNPTITNYFGGIGLSSPDCIPTTITNTPITDVIINTIPVSGALYGKVIVDSGSITATNNFNIAPGGAIIVSGGTLDISGRTIEMGGTTSINGRGTALKTSGSGTLISSSSTLLAFNGEGNITGNNLTLNGSTRINQKFTPLPSGGLTIGATGVLDIRSGSYVNLYAPTYATGSELIYNSSSSYERRVEWSSNIGGSYGVPHHVTISNSTTLNYPFESPGALGITGNLTINSGSSLYMDYGNINSNGALTVMGNIISAGNLSLGTVLGNDLKLGGDITFNSGYTFNAKERAVFFIKNGTQIISAATPPTFHYVVFAPSSGSTTVQLNTDASITAPAAGEVIKFSSSNDVFDLNGKQLTLGTANTDNQISGSGSFKGSATSGLTLLGNGTIGTLNFTTDFRDLGYLTINRQNATTALNLGTDLTIHHNLTLTKGLLFLGNSDVKLTKTATHSGASSNSYVISDVSTTGRFKKNIDDTTGDFTFPIGDKTSSDDGSNYSPATLHFSGGNYSATAYMALAVNDIKHPSVEATSTDYLTRYWSLTTTGITENPTYTFSGTYLPVDIVGTETNCKAGKWNGNNWTEADTIGSNTLNITIPTNASSTSVNEISAASTLGFPEINVVGNNISIASGDTTPDSADFTDFGNSSTTRFSTFLIQNTTGSKGILKIENIIVSGTNALDFNIIQLPPSSIESGGTGYLIIKFAPLGEGIRTALVTITSNDVDEGSYTFAIQGQGIDYTECSFGLEEIIASQDFEDTPSIPTLNYTGGTGSSGTGYGQSGDGGTTNMFLGSKSLQINNTTTEIIFDGIDTSQLSEANFSFRLAAFSNAAGISGMDAGDFIKISISKDGTTWTDELEIRGNSNAKWSFTNGIGNANAIYDGNNVIENKFAPKSGGYRTTDGYGFVQISHLPLQSNLKIKITASNNSATANEIWAIDNVELKAKRKASKTWNGTAWIGGAPTNSDVAIIAENYNSATVGTGFNGCQCEIVTGKTLTVASEHQIDIQSDFSNFGTVIFEDSSSLLQHNKTAVNTGNITMKRNSNPMFRYDFTYWSSPLTLDSNFKLGTDAQSLSPGTFFDKYYSWNADNSLWQTINFGNQVMIPATGYAVRAPQSFYIEGQAGAFAQPYTASFVGKPNNGDVMITVSGSSVVTPPKWNLIGNPYPSAINIETFLSVNSSLLDGTIYLWTHNTQISPSGTGSYTYNPSDYASYNFTGYAATNIGNPSGSDNNTNIPNKFVGTGQAFFVKGLSDGTVTFNNSIRVATNNSQFFRTASTVNEKHRIWLNLTGQDAFNQTLIGYVENATNGLDWGFDGDHFGGNKVTLYSIQDNKNLVIQGRALPFSNQDVVPLGYKTTLNGTLKISIDHFDGLFDEQDIYLEDLLLNVIHDLKDSDYTFTTTSGTFDNRFVLRYVPQEDLNNPDYEDVANKLIVYQNEKTIIVKSQVETLEQITVYDLLGRIVFDQSNINQNEFSIQNVVANLQPLIVKVKLANGQIVNKKMIF